jgi:acetylornithine deacetylase/succinyl-diaminopimelate desuccinylase-like protein
VTPPHEELRAELAELIASPSVSADPVHAGDLDVAAAWVADRIRGAGGEADVLPWNGRPLVIGEVKASRDAEGAPTILCYAHFDVQPPDPLELWDSPPFELHERDGWLYARGVADDKGQLYMLLKAAELLAGSGDLPVNLRFAFDGEEEVGGQSVVEWLAQDRRGADAAVVLDGGMESPGQPAFDVALRGLCYFHVHVRASERDLHSGVYGGAALNAMHALMETLSGVLPRDGAVPVPLSEGVIAPSSAEKSDWAALNPGLDVLEKAGAHPADALAGTEFYDRVWALPAVDVHGIAGGSPDLVKTVIPAEAWANLSMRLAPGQSSEWAAVTFERLLREAAPPGTDVKLTVQSRSEPALLDPGSRALSLAADAFEATVGARPLLLRVGGSIPLVAALGAKGIDAIVAGFALEESHVHSPNERLLAEYLSLGVTTVAELYRRLGDLG